jgi:hypothetical protein
MNNNIPLWKINKKEYDNQYLINKYMTDQEFREKRKAYNRELYRKKKEKKYIEENGSLEGFKYNSYIAAN